MWRPPDTSSTNGHAPPFWPPRANRLWSFALEPLRQFYLHKYFGIKKVEMEGHVNVIAPIGGADGILLAPNHSHDSDPHVMIQVVRWLSRRPHFMAAWQIFLGHKGIDGFVLQRMGAFSVDREGCDRRAIRQAIDILARGQALVIFPEGEIFHLNDRLTPLREGVAFIASSAQREIEKRNPHARVWIVPTAIRYRYVDNIVSKLESTMAGLEQRMLLTAPPGMPLSQRIIRFGELMLTLKEKDLLGHSSENEGDLPTRIKKLINTLLEKLETEHLHHASPQDSVPMRVKAIRRHLLQDVEENVEASSDESNGASDGAMLSTDPKILSALDRLHVVLQLYSYPGDYLSDDPCVERMAETIEKFEEDIYGISRVKGQRIARVVLGQPIDVREHLKSAARPRVVAAELTAKLEKDIQTLMAKS